MTFPLLLFVASTLIAGAEPPTRKALCDAIENAYASGTTASLQNSISPARILLLSDPLGLAIIRTEAGGLFLARRNRTDDRRWDCSESMAFSIGNRPVRAKSATLLASDPQTGDFSVLLETDTDGRWIYLVNARNVLKWNLVSRNAPQGT